MTISTILNAYGISASDVIITVDPNTVGNGSTSELEEFANEYCDWLRAAGIEVSLGNENRVVCDTEPDQSSDVRGELQNQLFDLFCKTH